MNLKILGCFGSETPGKYLSSYLLDGRLLLDGGSATASLTLDEQAEIEAVIVTHSHLDHIKDLAFLADNIIGRIEKPLEVYGTEAALGGLRDHLLNNVIWPDFTQIPTPENPVFHYNFIEPEKEFEVLGYRILPVETNHTVLNTALFVTDRENTLLYTSDTGPTERVWEVAGRTESLTSVITEISFPNDMRELAEISGHLTPEMCKAELAKMKRNNLPVYIVHLKAGFVDKLKAQIEKMGLSNLRVLRQGETLEI